LKILTILGARPQFIKAASVSREIAKYQEIIEVILHTGQHYDACMSSIFFDEMEIPLPDYQLNIGSKTHGAMTAKMIEKIEKVSIAVRPDWIMVYGDTNSTLAGAIVASKLGVKLAHVEAGLRSFNMNMPEEINRILTDRVSHLLFCPSRAALINLKNEGFNQNHCKYFNVGDVMFDGAIYYKMFAKKPLVNITNDYILCTIHRAENTDNTSRLKAIFFALNKISKDRQVILPLHPRTRKIIQTLGLNTNNITVIDPVGYLEMIWMIVNCSLVMTDSGGLQKEAYFFNKHCITLRDETEWVELVDLGVNTLAGADSKKIMQVYLSGHKPILEKLNKNIYGDGKASEKIVKEILNYK
jgi:UDP-GlcNAc3NAcA epimerase